MDGINTEKITEYNLTDGTSSNELSIFPEVSTVITDIKGDLPEEVPDGAKTSAFAENIVEEKPFRETGILKGFRRGICFALGMIGVLSYGYLGFCGVQYLKDGGFRTIVADSVFGGIITEVGPVPQEGELEVSPENESIPNNSSNAEYLNISSEDIGCTDPKIIFNETKYDTDTGSVSASAAVPEFREGSAVLIIHTHGTEGYTSDGEEVLADEDFRTDDPEKSIVAVGKSFAEILTERGIETFHCTSMFDKESYIDAYARSAEAVAQYMKEYPQIAYVIDIHRDAVIREDGTVVRSDGGSGAQLMIVCGTDEMGADFPDWRENLAFGAEYQNRLYETDPKLIRHMNLRSASFNQQLCDRYLLLEVGTCGNTLTEAVASAETAADVFADMILDE